MKPGQSKWEMEERSNSRPGTRCALGCSASHLPGRRRASGCRNPGMQWVETFTWMEQGEGDGPMRRRALLQCFYAGVANRESVSLINVSAC